MQDNLTRQIDSQTDRCTCSFAVLLIQEVALP